MSCKELSQEELASTNGCGSSYWLVSWARLPKWLLKKFTRCCNFHDLDYQYQRDKDQADDNLYNCCMYDAFHSPWWQKWIKIIITEIMYSLVTSKISNVCYKKGAKDEG